MVRADVEQTSIMRHVTVARDVAIGKYHRHENMKYIGKPAIRTSRATLCRVEANHAMPEAKAAISARNKAGTRGTL